MIAASAATTTAATTATTAATSAGYPAGDPLFLHGLTWQVWAIVIVKVLIVFALLMISVLFMVMYERKAIAHLGNRWGPEPGPRQRLVTVAGRRYKAVFQRGYAARGRGQVGVQSGARYRPRPGLRGLLYRPGRRDDNHRRLHHTATAGQPTLGHPAFAYVLERGRLRGDAGRLGVGLQVPVDGRGALRARR